MNSIPSNEAARMSAVKRYDILDTPPDGAFDRITAIAARRFDVPISIISIVDHDRIWFKSHHGLDVKQIGRDPGLCASAILSDMPHVLLRTPHSTPVHWRTRLWLESSGCASMSAFRCELMMVSILEPFALSIRNRAWSIKSKLMILRDLASVVMDQMELRLSARQAIGQAQLMAKEIDHRVTNSLQFISGLLMMQGRSSNSETASHLQMAANRVAAVAQVHRNFYTNEAEETSCITFLHRLCADLSGILGTPIEVHGDEGKVPTTRIQPIGLMLNELVTNAAKHGAGRINVEYTIIDGIHELSVCDEGDGLPNDFNPAGTAGLGMKVVTTLARQLGGQMTAQANPAGQGACFKVAYRA